jgi:hypothetical protein
VTLGIFARGVALLPHAIGGRPIGIVIQPKAAGQAVPSAIERWCSRLVEQPLQLLS